MTGDCQSRYFFFKNLSSETPSQNDTEITGRWVKNDARYVGKLHACIDDLKHQQKSEEIVSNPTPKKSIANDGNDEGMIFMGLWKWNSSIPNLRWKSSQVVDISWVSELILWNIWRRCGGFPPAVPDFASWGSLNHGHEWVSKIHRKLLAIAEFCTSTIFPHNQLFQTLVGNLGPKKFQRISTFRRNYTFQCSGWNHSLLSYMFYRIFTYMCLWMFLYIYDNLFLIYAYIYCTSIFCIYVSKISEM